VTIGPRGGGGRITVDAKGAAFPCTLTAPQAPPATVVLRIAGTRYCAAFDAPSVRANTVGRFRAARAPAPAACPDDDVTIASLNVLHGLFCPEPTAGCRRVDRTNLLAAFVVARGCPDLLAFQEVSCSAPNVELLRTTLQNVCPVPFSDVYDGTNPFDDEMVFSRHPILSHQTLDLLGPLRNLLWVRIDHPIGPLDVYVTHLASGGDLATSPCAGTFGPCPPACIAAGATTVRDCQAVQVGLRVDATHDVATPALLVGDFNESPGSFVYDQFANRGWSDTTLAAGNPECVPATGVGCTSGREDEDLTDLEDAALNQTERIDFVWLIPPGAGSTCTATLDDATDADADGTATRLFADEPNPFAPACGASPDAVCWTSDHTGVQADVNCF
jgi:endonuclease/exonuclease/phosphatase family metal-dependent hydrolase